MTFNATLRGWADVLNRVRSVAPSAFLAGGAMRDLDNERPIKDLDVFYNEATLRDDVLGKALHGLYSYKNACNGAYIDAASEILFTTVMVPTSCVGPDLNLINVAPGFDTTLMLERMDFGICLIGFNGQDVIRTPAYLKDQQAQTFTLTRADSVEGTMRSLKRYDRLVQKYEGWKLMIPPELQEVAGKAKAYHDADKAAIAEFKQDLESWPQSILGEAQERYEAAPKFGAQ